MRRVQIEKIDAQHLFLALREFAQQEIGATVIDADFRDAATKGAFRLRLQKCLEDERIRRVDVTFDAAQLLEYKPAVFNRHAHAIPSSCRLRSRQFERAAVQGFARQRRCED